MQVYVDALANLLGAYMWGSRVKVAAALAAHIIVLAFLLLVFLAYGSTHMRSQQGVMQVAGLLAALATSLLWWYAVFRDHQKDDLPMLQRNIAEVESLACEIAQLKAKVQVWTAPGGAMQCSASEWPAGFSDAMARLPNRVTAIEERCKLLVRSLKHFEKLLRRRYTPKSHIKIRLPEHDL